MACFLRKTTVNLFQQIMDYPLRTSEQLEPILKAFRKSRGLSQKQLAEKLGVTQQALSLLESAPHRASLARLLSVFAALNVEIVLREKGSGSVSGPGEW